MDEIPNQDIAMSEELLRDNEWVFVAFLTAIAGVAREHAAVNDWDARDALDSLARTWRTLQSGLYYESKPVNLRAGEIYQAVQAAVANIRETAAKAGEMAVLPDATVLGVMVFLQRLERAHNNGRTRSRAFVALLNQFTPEEKEEKDSDASVQPAAPLLIL